MDMLVWALVAPSLWRKEVIRVLPPSFTSYILHSAVKCRQKKKKKKEIEGNFKISDAVPLVWANRIPHGGCTAPHVVVALILPPHPTRTCVF